MNKLCWFFVLLIILSGCEEKKDITKRPGDVQSGLDEQQQWEDDQQQEQEERRYEISEYPVMVAPDPDKRRNDQKSTVFDKVSKVLIDEGLTVIDIASKEESLRQEMKQTGEIGGYLRQDFLFSKFNAADVCVYIWSEAFKEPSGIPQVDYWWGSRIGYKVVDVTTSRLLASGDEQVVKQDFRDGDEESKARRAIIATLKKIIPKLKRKLQGELHKIIKNTVRIEGLISDEEQLQEFSAIIKDLEADRYFKIKNTAGKGFLEYDVVLLKRNVPDLAEAIQEAAENEGILITATPVRKKIKIALKKEVED